MFFILEKIASFLLFFGIGWMSIQILVLLAACAKGNSWREIESYLRAKHGVLTDEDAVQPWVSDPHRDERQSLRYSASGGPYSSSAEDTRPLRRAIVRRGDDLDMRIGDDDLD